jgi:hypothetical protein
VLGVKSGSYDTQLIPETRHSDLLDRIKADGFRSYTHFDVSAIERFEDAEDPQVKVQQDLRRRAGLGNG